MMLCVSVQVPYLMCRQIAIWRFSQPMSSGGTMEITQ